MKKITLLAILLLTSNCSSYIEETINAEFIPLKPTLAEMKTTNPTNGSIYSISSPGLFSADKRAHKVGDILTVQLSETFSSTKSVSTATSKADAIGAEVGPTGFLRNFAGIPIVRKLPPVDQFDAIVITDLGEPQKEFDKIVHFLGSKRVFIPPFLGVKTNLSHKFMEESK